MEHRDWTDKEIITCIQAEKFSLEGFQQRNNALSFMANRMIMSLTAKKDLFVKAYQIEKGKTYNDYSQWQEIGIMSFDEYYKMIQDNSFMHAFHPVNFKSLAGFDQAAL